MKNITLVLVSVIVIILGLTSYVQYSKNKNIPAIENPITQPDSTVQYNNTEYGFTFTLPNNWKGYETITNTWQGNPLTNTGSKETGPKILIRNPKWTASLPYEDIPILIFTIAQWNSYSAENFAVSAAPISATELARNNVYVFALPPRWDFDYSEDFKEAQAIVNMKPLKPYTIPVTSSSIN